MQWFDGPTEFKQKTRRLVVRFYDGDRISRDEIATSVLVIVPVETPLAEAIEAMRAKIVTELDRYALFESAVALGCSRPDEAEAK